ncbi:hypothetical protein [Stenotrophomonas sp. PS02289]|uniref:hypothetical protein n=1 Tax=Stenotrophomonas sp. PS02289 TaxID=2991422 RepID=UPI00249A209C|nr:hypothetical protein [Stenotrophomonas sp. PS02289]
MLGDAISVSLAMKISVPTGLKTTSAVAGDALKKGGDGAAPLNVGNAPGVLGERRENQQQRIMTRRMNDFMTRAAAAADSRLLLNSVTSPPGPRTPAG